MKTVLIIAGGTGGHIFPALTVAHELKREGISIFWMGAETGMEKNLVGDQFPLYLLPVKGLRGKNLLEKIKTPFRLLRSICLAYLYIQKIKPDVVLGMGGYASAPGGIAAKLARIPLVIHEQNALPGLTNKWLSKIATKTLQAFPSAFSEKAKTVGNPVRAALQAVKRDEDHYKKREKPWKILVLGGSQGARFINQLIVDFIAQHSDAPYVFWHQTGKADFESVKKSYGMNTNQVYQVAPFVDDMASAYAWADLVIARSGALTVSEIAAVGLPAIFIPFPQAVDDHQFYNAAYLAKAGGAKVFRQSEVTVEKLQVVLNDLFSDPMCLQQMAMAAKQCAKPEATVDIIAALRS